MRFMLNMSCDNAAFGEDAGDLAEEVSRILFIAARRVQDRQTEGTLRDANGNTVGRWQFIDDGEGE